MNRLRELRKKKGVSQVELSRYLDVAQPTYSGWESGRFQIDDENKIKLAEYYNVSIDYLLGRTNTPTLETADKANKGVRIPVLGNVPAGIPLEAITDIIDYEEISPTLAACGEYFALRIKGDSMAPRICDGDVVIVKKESAADSGDVAIVMVNGNEATCKEILISNAGVTLIGWNVAAFSPMFFTKEDVEKLPVKVIGRVVEVRIKNLKRGR